MLSQCTFPGEGQLVLKFDMNDWVTHSSKVLPRWRTPCPSSRSFKSRSQRPLCATSVCVRLSNVGLLAECYVPVKPRALIVSREGGGSTSRTPTPDRRSGRWGGTHIRLVSAFASLSGWDFGVCKNDKF